MELIQQENIYITKTKKTEIEKIDFATCAQPTQTLENYCNTLTKKPAIIVNGGLFTFSTGKSVMDFIDEGIIQSEEDWIQYGFGIDGLGNMIYAKDTDKVWRDFVSAYPPLVVNGEIQKVNMASEISAKNRRTILGYNDEYVFTICIDTPGATFPEAALIALNAGCKYAINLDGGGSTRLLYQNKAYATASYNRPVDNIVAIYVKQQQQTTTSDVIYRVQLGAFAAKANADSYCAKVKQLGENYKNAFVKYIEPYFKVQVGAFSIKQNAENMIKDLKEKGYNAFIITEKKTELKEELKVMSNSSLVAVTVLSPNHSGNRSQKIDRITPHCVVGQCTAEALGAWFAKSSTQASSNYGIDKDGRVGMYVEEKNRSWCSSSSANDNRAVTIECASDTTDPYRMNDAVYNTLIRLCVDICKRNGKDTLLWFNDKNYALNYQPKSNEMLLTVHRWFANKSCPGDWLYSRLGDLAAKVTAALKPANTTPTPVEEEEEMTQEKFNEMMNIWLETQAAKEPSAWSADARAWAEGKGYIQGDEKGRKMYKKPLTREEFIQVLYRIEK